MKANQPRFFRREKVIGKENYSKEGNISKQAMMENLVPAQITLFDVARLIVALCREADFLAVEAPASLALLHFSELFQVIPGHVIVTSGRGCHTA